MMQRTQYYYCAEVLQAHHLLLALPALIVYTAVTLKLSLAIRKCQVLAQKLIADCHKRKADSEN
jgi:hypothetical protein